MKKEITEGDTIKQNSELAHMQTHYKPEYCELVKRHMEMGYSFDTLVGKIGVSRKTLYKWVDQFPAFSKAKDEAFSLAQDFFERRLMAKISGQDLSSIGISTKGIDTTCLIFALKTRFHKTYGDRAKVETEHSVSEETKKLIIDMSE